MGGWRNHGVDPSRFSRSLIEKCETLVQSGKFDANQPVQLLSRAYNQLYTIQDLIGSATACIAIFDRKCKRLYTANLGDSGFLVIRNGKVVHKSNPQVHGFNAPWQLSIVPQAQKASSYGDLPQKAAFTEFQCEEGDILLLASDGLFDNVPDSHITQLLEKLGVNPEQLLDSGKESVDSGTDSGDDDKVYKLQYVLENAASNMVAYTRSRAYDKKYISPFALEARKYGYDATGGKVDDITILIGVVAK